jgi:hypothetical protein
MSAEFISEVLDRLSLASARRTTSGEGLFLGDRLAQFMIHTLSLLGHAEELQLTLVVVSVLEFD